MQCMSWHILWWRGFLSTTLTLGNKLSTHVFFAWNWHNKIWQHVLWSFVISDNLTMRMLSNNIRYDIILCPISINDYGIWPHSWHNCKYKFQASFQCNLLMIWAPIKTTYYIYQSGIPMPIAFGAIVGYNGSPNWFVLKMELIAQEFFTQVHFHYFMDFEVSR